MNDDEFAELVESTNSPAAKRIAELERELADLREILPKVLVALGNGSGCSPSCSVEFMRQIPNEARLVVDGLKRELEQERQDSRHYQLELLRVRRERNDARAIIDATLKALPVGYIPAHTPESLPGRVADLVSELGRLTAMIDANDDMRDLLREIYNLTQIGPGHHPQMPAQALELIAILIEDKTPPP